MKFATLLAVAVLLPAAASAEELTGRVVDVPDGDVVTLQAADGGRLEIRLMEIEAPEPAQPWGPEARRMLSDMVLSRTVRVDAGGADRDGITLGYVYLGEMDVNAEMVRRGGAWAFEHLMAREPMLKVQAEAKAARRGLWAQPADAIMPPREWRQIHRDP